MDPSQIEYMIIDFPGELRADLLVPQLRTMVEQHAVEIVDLAFVRKEPDGSVRTVELDRLEPEHAAVFDALDGEILGLLSDEDLTLVGEQLPMDSVAAVLVWENTTTRSLRRAVQDAGGTVIAHEHVPQNVVERDLTAIRA